MRVTVKDLMTRKPATVLLHATLNEAAEVLLEREVGELYVVDHSERLQGILPDYELLKAQLMGLPSHTKVELLMSCNPATVTPSTDLPTIALAFRQGSCHQMAVIDEGRLIGQVCRLDILRLFSSCEHLEWSFDVPDESEDDQSAATLRGPQLVSRLGNPNSKVTTSC